MSILKTKQRKREEEEKEKKEEEKGKEDRGQDRGKRGGTHIPETYRILQIYYLRSTSYNFYSMARRSVAQFLRSKEEFRGVDFRNTPLPTRDPAAILGSQKHYLSNLS